MNLFYDLLSLQPNSITLHSHLSKASCPNTVQSTELGGPFSLSASYLLVCAKGVITASAQPSPRERLEVILKHVKNEITGICT